jgi:transposase
MPNPKAQAVMLSEKERQGLEQLAKRHKTAQQIGLRARIVLASAEGKTNTSIAEKNEVSHNTARLWRNRWVSLQEIPLEELSVEERLQDVPRPGAPSQITADQRCQIEALACEKPEESERPITHWSAREIADEIISRKIVKQISPRHAARLLKRSHDQAALNPLLVDDRER